MREKKIIGLPGGGRWIVLNDGKGLGGASKPEGHPMHTTCIAEYRGSRSTRPETFLSLEYALKESWVPEVVKEAARQVLEGWS
jgi:hypothetical protein